MLRLTLAQMRRNLGRLSAAGIAVVLGTAFVAATLLAGAVLTRTTYDAVTVSLADADLVLTDGDVTERVATLAREVPGVAVVDRQVQTSVEVAGPGGRLWSVVKAPAADPRLEAETLAAGALPTGPDEIALPEQLAGTLGAGIGATVRTRVESWVTEEDGSTAPTERTADLTVTGLLDDGSSAFLGTGGTAVVTAPLLEQWLALQDPTRPDGDAWVGLVALEPGAVTADVQRAVRDAVGDTVSVRTLDETAAALTADLTGSTQAFTAIVLGFAAVALLVAGLVITNTFQVLVAQRTRTLALLRCVGADRAQLRRSVVTEALLVGAAASVAGLLLGAGVVQAALAVLRATGTDVPLPATISITPAVVLVPLAAGLLVTVLAALVPARAATRGAPLAALRPADAPAARRAGRLRTVAAVVLVVGGGLGLAAGTVLARDVDLLAGLAVGVLGGAASFVGVVVAAVLWVPALVRLTGRLLRRSASARLATANGVRNPHRTAATSAALLIGVTLVAMMSTGAASTRTALDASLDEQYPVDIAVSTVGLDSTPLPEEVRTGLPGVEGIRAVAPVRSALLLLGPDETPVEAAGIDPADGGVLRDGNLAGLLADDTVVVSPRVAEWSGVRDGDEVTLLRDEDRSTAVTLRVAVSEEAPAEAVLTRDALTRVAPDAAVTATWLRLADLDDAEEVVLAVDSLVSDAEIGLSTSGAAVERAFYQRVTDTLLAVVVGLLGVAVVIALVGVANTLSLSVLERRRESATLRALGMSRAQLRGSLAVEGALISLVGAVVGAALGTVYGWVGARTLLGEISVVGLEVPWAHLAAVLGVALVAGLLASVLPARSAVRTSPVAALAVD